MQVAGRLSILNTMNMISALLVPTLSWAFVSLCFVFQMAVLRIAAPGLGGQFLLFVVIDPIWDRCRGWAYD